MNDRKIDFIICTNDTEQFEEACLYINALKVPRDFSVNILKVEHSASIFSGYNQAMSASDARYKVYLHQDVRIIDAAFLYTLLEKFSDPEVGMLGVVGSSVLGAKPFLWDAGVIAETRVNTTYCQRFSEKIEDHYVKQIDGLLMATQYDLPWREDLFDGWDLYDRSQCCEFVKAGYRILVPAQEQPICLHDCGIVSLSDYGKNNEKFLRYYAGMFDVKFEKEKTAAENE